MRMILGLDAPTSGRATVNGRPLTEHDAPLTEIGALLDAKAVHPKRSARNHLRALAATTGIPDRRVDEVLDMVGLEDVADRPAGGFSLGMGQRLGIASALLGDPETVMLDEPVNGLDPEGILWIRGLLKGLADEGRTVFVSSHLMSEMAMTAEHFVIIGGGRLIADVPAAELEAMAAVDSVIVRSPDSARLPARSSIGAGGTVDVEAGATDRFSVTGLARPSASAPSPPADGLVLHELTPQQASLEEIFMDLTRDSVEYHAVAPPPRKGLRDRHGHDHRHHLDADRRPRPGGPRPREPSSARPAPGSPTGGSSAASGSSSAPSAPPPSGSAWRPLAAVLLGVMFSSIAGSGGTTGGAGPGPAMTSSDPVALSLSGFHLTQLIVGVLGVLVVTAEYSTGMIRTTFAAVTRRLSVLEAKVVVFGGVTLARAWRSSPSSPSSSARPPTPARASPPPSPTPTCSGRCWARPSTPPASASWASPSASCCAARPPASGCCWPASW